MMKTPTANDRTSPLHLLWAAPLALVVGAGFWAISLWSWCGGGLAVCGPQTNVPELVALILTGVFIGAVFAGGMIAVAPWTRHRGLRIGPAVGVTAFFLLSAVAYLLTS